MKRHKYKLKKHVQLLSKKGEIEHGSLVFFKEHQILGLNLLASEILKEHYVANSRVNAFCVVSGRVRFSFKLVSNSRHVFFARWSKAVNTGFFMSSW